jgi:hypothetical protein
MISSFMNVDDLVHFTLREWTRMSMSPGVAEVERAKSQLKASLLLGLDGTTAIAEDVSAAIRLEPTFGHTAWLTYWRTDRQADGHHRQKVHAQGD